MQPPRPVTPAEAAEDRYLLQVQKQVDIDACRQLHSRAVLQMYCCCHGIVHAIHVHPRIQTSPETLKPYL